VIIRPCPNFGDRRDGKSVGLIILHYTETKGVQETLDILFDPARKASAHYVLDINGTVYQLVDESKRAWHAGKSWWQGEIDINSTSIGIEIQNSGITPFPDQQIKALIDLCHGIIKRHNIQSRDVLGHSDIAITRKIDPGHLFPWQELAAQGIGFWPQEKDLAADKAESVLNAIGYDPALPLVERITAFQRHFVPEVFVSNDGIGLLTPLTLKRLGGFVQNQQTV